MIVLTVIEAAMDIGPTPRDRVSHKFVVNQPKNSDLGHRGHARPLDRQITGMDGFDPLDSRHCFLANGFPADPINSTQVERIYSYPS
jgi:hypothetical protein